MKNQDNIAKQLNDITARLENLRLSNKRIGDEINAAIEEINNLQAVVEYTEESQEQRTSSVPRKEVKVDLQGFKRYNGHPVHILNTKRGEPQTLEKLKRSESYMLLLNCRMVAPNEEFPKI